ncbi:MAG: hypothetical protein K0S21_1734 [Rhizobiaceae bacterium]|nr:hypothetical protein [Rhizobiaceae bacterium]
MEKDLDALEKAIRSSFEKGNAEDRAYREKVYRSAFAALDRAIQANPGITVERAIGRRRDLQAKIAIIESEFLPAVRAAAEARRAEPVAEDEPPLPDLGPPPDIGSPDAFPPPPGAPADLGHPAGYPQAAPVASAPPVEPAVPAGRATAAPFVEPPVSRAAATPPEFAPEPVMADHAGAAATGISPEIDVGAERQPPFGRSGEIEDVAPDRNDVRVRQARRSYGRLMLAATFLSAVAIGGWWAYRTGLIGFPEDGAVPNPPQIVEDEDFSPGGDIVPPPVTAQSPQRNWVNVFSASDASQVGTPAGAAAEVQEDESGTFLRVRSGGDAVIFDVGQGVLEQIAGRKAVFDIVARAAEGKETQISVDCNFGELGDCGRKRYEVGYEKSEYLFEVDLPENRPGAAGSIAVNSDFDNQGKAVDIYEIRVSVVE